MSIQDQETDTRRLQSLVEKHTVYYEVSPECSLVDGKQVKVGFELRLYGTHDHGKTLLRPGCEVCVRTFEDLRQIAAWIVPREERASWYEVQPFDQALHLTPKHNLRPEVALTLKILHRHGFNDPIDECEERCLKEMEEKLSALGVHLGR
jgi:hypothetical protein